MLCSTNSTRYHDTIEICSRNKRDIVMILTILFVWVATQIVHGYTRQEPKTCINTYIERFVLKHVRCIQVMTLFHVKLESVLCCSLDSHAVQGPIYGWRGVQWIERSVASKHLTRRIFLLSNTVQNQIIDRFSIHATYIEWETRGTTN